MDERVKWRAIYIALTVISTIVGIWSFSASILVMAVPIILTIIYFIYVVVDSARSTRAKVKKEAQERKPRSLLTQHELKSYHARVESQQATSHPPVIGKETPTSPSSSPDTAPPGSLSW